MSCLTTGVADVKSYANRGRIGRLLDVELILFSSNDWSRRSRR
jgi:hypothetical protein